MTNSPKYPNLSNAPITEALIDIQVVQNEPPAIESLRNVVEAIKDDFPVVEDRIQTSIQVEFNKGEATTSRGQSPQGFNARSTDGLYVVQILMGRLTVSRLAPYVSWDDLREKAEHVWRIYLDNVNPLRVTRLATRYINRIELPDEPFELSGILKKPVEMPEGLPEGVGSYFVKLAIPDPDTGSVAFVHQILEGGGPQKQPFLIFDIDVFMQVDMDVQKEDVWETLEGLRGYKNRIFFGCLTDEAIEQFK